MSHARGPPLADVADAAATASKEEQRLFWRARRCTSGPVRYTIPRILLRKLFIAPLLNHNLTSIPARSRKNVTSPISPQAAQNLRFYVACMPRRAVVVHLRPLKLLGKNLQHARHRNGHF